MDEMTIQVHEERDVLLARQAGRIMAVDLGFGSADQTRFVTAISELTRNLLEHAGEGTCTITDLSNPTLIVLQVEVEDHGPGIPDIDLAMTDGFSTGNSLGAGLPGTRRLVHEFSIESEPGHTKIVIAMVKQRDPYARQVFPRAGAPARQGAVRELIRL